MDDEEDERRLQYQEARSKEGQGRRKAKVGRGEIVDTEALANELEPAAQEEGDYF